MFRIGFDGFVQEIEIHGLLGGCAETSIMQRFIESAEVSVNDRFCGSRRGLGQFERYLFDENKSLDGGVKCGFVGDEEECVQMCVDPSVI
jgi:hypothetical protein